MGLNVDAELGAGVAGCADRRLPAPSRHDLVALSADQHVLDTAPRDQFLDARLQRTSGRSLCPEFEACFCTNGAHRRDASVEIVSHSLCLLGPTIQRRRTILLQARFISS